MIKKIFILIGIISLSSGILASDLDDLTARSDRVQKVVKSAVSEKDTGKLVSVFSDDIAIITPVGTSFEGKMTIRATLVMLFPFVDSGDIELTRLSISIVDDEGYETGKYTIIEKLDDGKTRNTTGRFVIIWEMKDNQWLIKRLITIR